MLADSLIQQTITRRVIVTHALCRSLTEGNITMDRRKLIVGGSAAAVAATLAVMAGKGIPLAAASTIDAEPTSTADHARRVLNLVDVDLGLVNPAGLQNQLEQGCAAYLASPAPRDTEPTVATDMEAWTAQRMVDLCGSDSFEAVTEIPQTRTLLAFGLLACSQHQEGEPPQTYRGMPVPAVLEALEADFFPVLLDQIGVKSNGSPSFANALQASSAELDRVVATLAEIQSASMQARSLSRTQVAALIFVVVANLALFCTDGWGDV